MTTLLRAAGDGDLKAVEQVVQALYGDLRRLAHSRLRRSGELTLLDTTSLVHESYLRFQKAGQLDLTDRKHFFAYAARVMAFHCGGRHSRTPSRAPRRPAAARHAQHGDRERRD